MLRQVFAYLLISPVLTELAGVPAQPVSAQQVVAVNAVLSSATAEQVERQVTVPIERGLLSLPAVLTIKSRSKDGAARIEISFQHRPGAADVEAVNRALAGVARSLPAASRVEPAEIKESGLP